MSKGFIYFISEVPFTDYPVKIGYSQDPVERLTELQTANPYKLGIIMAIEGTMQEERSLHHRFRHLSKRLCGEWFEPGSELVQYVKEVAQRKRIERGIEYARYHLDNTVSTQSIGHEHKHKRVENSQVETISELKWRHRIESAKQVLNLNRGDLEAIIEADNHLRNKKKE